MTNYIDINELSKESMHEVSYGVTLIIFGTLVVIIGYWFESVVFTEQIGLVVADIPGFVKNLGILNVGKVVAPYLTAFILFYIGCMMVIKHIPLIELTMIEKITSKTIESVKTTKKTLNTNEYIMNLKKLIETRSVLTLFTDNFIPTGLLMIGIMYHFFRIQFGLGLSSVVIMILFVMAMYHLEMQNLGAAEEKEIKIDQYCEDIQDIVVNLDTLLVSNTKEKEMGNVNKSKENTLTKYIASDVATTELALGLHVVVIITAVILNGLALNAYTNNLTDIARLSSILLLSLMFIKACDGMIVKLRNVTHFLGKYTSLQKYFHSFAIKPESPKDLIIKDGSIRFENISISYEDTMIVNNFNMDIKGNTTVGIIGGIGSGKTSIVKSLAGLVKYSGEIYVDDQDIRTCNYKSLMKHIVYIQQHPKMFNKTILYNLTYGTDYDIDATKKFLKKI